MQFIVHFGKRKHPTNGVVFVPDKKTCTEMLIAKTVTVENVNTTIDGTKELIDYIFEKVNAK